MYAGGSPLVTPIPGKAFLPAPASEYGLVPKDRGRQARP